MFTSSSSRVDARRILLVSRFIISSLLRYHCIGYGGTGTWPLIRVLQYSDTGTNKQQLIKYHGTRTIPVSHERMRRPQALYSYAVQTTALHQSNLQSCIIRLRTNVSGNSVPVRVPGVVTDTTRDDRPITATNPIPVRYQLLHLGCAGGDRNT